MTALGYIIRREHIQAAIDKAVARELPRLERFLEIVGELDELERRLPERVRKAQADAGASRPPSSKSAREAMSQSEDASREIDRVLTRKCNRADTATGVVKEVLAIARIDLKEANVLDNWISENDPTKAIYAERYRKRREFVDTMREFIAASSAA